MAYKTSKMLEQPVAQGLPTLRVHHQFFRVFQVSFAATAATVLKKTGLKSFPGGVFDDPVLMLQQPHQQEAQKLQRELPSTMPEDTWSTETSKQVVRQSNPSLNRDFSDFCRPWNCLSLRRNCIRELSWPNSRRITFRSCRVKHTLCPLLSSIE